MKKLLPVGLILLCVGAVAYDALQPAPPPSAEWKKGFVAGVREGVIARDQFPGNDSFDFYQERALSNYWYLHVAVPKIINAMAAEEAKTNKGSAK